MDNIVSLKSDFTQNIPARYTNLSFDDFMMDNIEQKFNRRFVECYVAFFPEISQRGMSIIFSGKEGTGKTMLAMIMKQALMKMGYTVHYETAFFLNYLKEMNAKECHPKFCLKEALNYYKQFNLLIIDNFTCGTELEDSLTGCEKQLLFTIFDHRYQNNLSTILISNHSQQELIEHLGAPLVDRLGENGVILTFNWHSYRQR
jgi:DNA replication protein DnaC